MRPAVPLPVRSTDPWAARGRLLTATRDMTVLAAAYKLLNEQRTLTLRELYVGS